MNGTALDPRSVPLHAARLLGATVTAAYPLDGGDLSNVMALTIARPGRLPIEAVVKTGPFPRREARMLACLREAGAPAPVVLGVDDNLLILERLPAGGSLASAWDTLGAGMRSLHSAHVPGSPDGTPYGWTEDFAFGALPVLNEWRADWVTFWRDHRLLCHLPHVPADLARRIERLAATLPDRLPAHPRPSLLHGDLWSGNVLVSDTTRSTEGGSTTGITGLIDPACCIGHAEADFAILTLFAQPEPRFWSAYGPLPSGWPERLAIYRLWPALVHLRLFGSGYRPMVDQLLASLT